MKRHEHIMMSRRQAITAGLGGTFALALAACGNNAGSDQPATSEGSDTVTGSLAIHITGLDYGPGVDKAILTLDYPLDAVTADTFVVEETKQATDFADPEFPVIEVTAPRTITDAYLVDEAGNKTTDPSTNVVIEMNIDPVEGSPFVFTMPYMYNMWSTPYDLAVSLAEGQSLTSGGTEVAVLGVEPTPTAKDTNADNWVEHTGTFGGIDYKYATFTPETESKNLFVWLHGVGEGFSGEMVGNDTLVPLLGNRVTRLAEDTFQNVTGGMNVLVPMSPTKWMDNGSHEPDADWTPHASMYLQSLPELIDSYAKEIGAEKIIVSGCSNGGYMTLNLALEYGDRYDGFIPISEGITTDLITEDEWNRLATYPMFFVYCEDDASTIDCNRETIKQLRAHGATDNLHESVSDFVRDTSGAFDYLNDGQPYVYNGHWAWCYFFNGEANDADGLNAFDWIKQIIEA